MYRIFITTLLVTSVQATMAMQSIRTAICKKPVTYTTLAASFSSALTYVNMHPEIKSWVKNPYHESEKKKLRSVIAEEFAQLYTAPESDDRR